MEYAGLELENFDKESKNIIKVPVCVDEEFSLDLSRLSENLKISIDKILNSLIYPCSILKVDYYLKYKQNY